MIKLPLVHCMFIHNFQVELILIGKKGETYFAKRPHPITATFELGGVADPDVAGEAADFLGACYVNLW